MTHLTTDELAQIVLTAVRSETGIDDATIDTSFGQLDVESLTFAEILMSIEDSVGTELGIEETFTPASDVAVQALVDAVSAALATKVEVA